jgi:hypothetical protein
MVLSLMLASEAQPIGTLERLAFVVSLGSCPVVSLIVAAVLVELSRLRRSANADGSGQT